jgi:hypothetical protein
LWCSCNDDDDYYYDDYDYICASSGGGDNGAWALEEMVVIYVLRVQVGPLKLDTLS